MKTWSLKAEHWTGEANAILASVLTTASNWLAPVPEAVMTGNAIEQIFDLGPTWALVVALSIEIAGFGVNAYYLEAQAFNENEEAYKAQHNRKTHKLPLENAEGARVAVIAFYIVTGCIIAVNAIYQVAAQGKPWIVLLAVLFPVASAIATSAANKRAALHRKRVQAIETEIQVQPVAVKPEPPPAPVVKLNNRQIAMIETLRRDKAANYTQLGQAHAVSRTTAKSDTETLIASGRLRRNGKGWEVKE